MKRESLRRRETPDAEGRSGVAMIPTLLVVSGIGIFALALLTSVLSTSRSANHMADDYRLSSSVESVAMLATETLWSGYLKEQGGAAGDLDSFRDYLTGLGIPDHGPGGYPEPHQGTSLLPMVGLTFVDGEAVFQDVTIDALRAFRRDVESDATQLYLTVSASTHRGKGLVNPVLNRAVQQVYTIEPEQFAGFEFAALANNIDCIFCHTSVDSVDRFYNADGAKYDSFERVKVGTLETLMLRHFKGVAGPIGDFDADSCIGGTVYVRGKMVTQLGTPLPPYSELAFQGYQFDASGLLVEDAFGKLATTPFVAADEPLEPLENLYLDYPTDYTAMVDGNLPTSFPPPFPDDGGTDPATGLPSAAGAGNKLVDDFEFFEAAEKAEGAITAGIVKLIPPGEKIDTTDEFVSAALMGEDSVQQKVTGNLILNGMTEPITIQGTVAVDGDLVISGYIKGEGSLLVRGNIYIPSDIQYLDGKQYLPGDPPGAPSGPRTFGIAQDGMKNAVGFAAGGNVIIGDYLAPAMLQPDLTKVLPLEYEITNGDSTGKWNFTLAEMSLFNRGEWAKTQAYLPNLPGEADDIDDPTLINPATGYPTTWEDTPNPGYIPDYVPRYYQFGDGDTVPIYNRGNLYFDAVQGAWIGDAEVPLTWDPDLLTLANPADASDPTLHPPGKPDAVLRSITPAGGWLADDVYKTAIEWFEDTRELGAPLVVDGLVYTNNAIFGLVSRYTPMLGQMIVNGALVAADLGLLVPGYADPMGLLPNGSALSNYAIGLQLNYDKRVKNMLNVRNPLQVQLKRTLWNPTANLL